MEHLFIKSRSGSDRTLILFHGTGGRETDLLEVAAMVNGSANILALRGAVEENGQARYFRRLSPREFDQESLRGEGMKTASLIRELSSLYGLDMTKEVYIGYSNGANMAAHLLLNHALPDAWAMHMHHAYISDLNAMEHLLRYNCLTTAG